jgi:hypothetical protein
VSGFDSLASDGLRLTETLGLPFRGSLSVPLVSPLGKGEVLTTDGKGFTRIRGETFIIHNFTPPKKCLFPKSVAIRVIRG